MVVLALGVAGQGVLDGCLVDCHLAGRSSAHCHDAGAEPGTLRVVGLTSCSHAHDAAWAVAQESPTNALGKVTLALQIAPVEIPKGETPCSHAELATGAIFSSPPSAFSAPLRL